MQLSTIIERATSLGLPIALNEFKTGDNSEVPDLPFLVYLYKERARGADGMNNIKEIDGSIELYTDYEPDASLESRIENEVLLDVEYEKYQATTDENLVQTAYDFSIVEKVRK